jgi:hypothetical protein
MMDKKLSLLTLLLISILLINIARSQSNPTTEITDYTSATSQSMATATATTTSSSRSLLKVNKSE